MEIVRRVQSMTQISRKARRRGLRVGFVPTMGYLHEGHLSLVRRIKDLSDLVVVSIFVNPTQFGPDEDFDRYPRDLMRDADLCIAEGVEYLFTPAAPDIYPESPGTWVEVADLSYRLEGASRPGHFRGVATVVLKLLNVVQPHIVAFGQKDAQQLAVIKRMARDLLVDVEVLEVPTHREEDGLAMSSRNAMLSPEQRAVAPALRRALEAAQQAVDEGRRQAEEVLGVAREVLEAENLLSIDYVALVDPESFENVGTIEKQALLLLAAFAGEVRLIDNMTLHATELA